MTFTFDPTAATDRERIRFAIRDTNGDAPMFSDEEIAFILVDAGSWQAAVIAMLEAKIAELANNPNFTADWLTVSVSAQLAAFQGLLDRKMKEYGIGLGTLQTGTISTAIDYPNITDFDEFFSDPLLWSGM